MQPSNAQGDTATRAGDVLDPHRRRARVALAAGLIAAAISCAGPAAACVWSPSFEREAKARIALLIADETQVPATRREALRATLAHELHMLATLQEQAGHYADAQRSLETLVHVQGRRSGARSLDARRKAERDLARVVARQASTGDPGPHRPVATGRAPSATACGGVR